MPELFKTLEKLDYPLVNLTARLYLTLFTNVLPEQASLRVLDLFLLEGMQSNKVIFDIKFGYLSIIEKAVVGCSDYEML